MQHTESVDSPVKVLINVVEMSTMGLIQFIDCVCVCETAVAWSEAGEKLFGYGPVMVCGQA